MARRAHARKQANDDESDGTKTRGAAGRGIWSGSISFGLLQIPITLYTAESRAEELHFRMLDKHDLSPIKFERVNATTGKKVEWKNIVKGFEYEKDNFVVIEPEELAKANVKATQTIDIQDFVPAEEIDPAYFETPYYAIPQARAQKAYVLLREALTKKKAVAIATFVLRTREHLCAVMPVGDALMVEMLRFGHELKDVDDMPLPTKGDKSISERELTMAEQLIEGMMTAWKPSKYKDRYFKDVMTLIEEKAKTGEVTEHHAKLKGTVANDVVDLLDLLKKSVEGSGGVKKTTKPRRRKKAA